MTAFPFMALANVTAWTPTAPKVGGGVVPPTHYNEERPPSPRCRRYDTFRGRGRPVGDDPHMGRWWASTA